MMLVAMTPRRRMAVLKAPTPEAPALVRPCAIQTISNRRQSRSCSLRGRRPVAARGSVPEADIAGRIDVGEAGHDAVGAHREGESTTISEPVISEDLGLVLGEVQQHDSGNCRRRRWNP